MLWIVAEGSGPGPAERRCRLQLASQRPGAGKYEWGLRLWSSVSSSGTRTSSSWEPTALYVDSKSLCPQFGVDFGFELRLTNLSLTLMRAGLQSFNQCISKCCDSIVCSVSCEIIDLWLEMIGWKRFYRQKVVPSRPKLGTLSINYVTGLFEIKEAITKRENFNAIFLNSQA